MTPAGYFLYNEEYEEWEETHAGTPNSVPLYTHSANPYQSITDTKIEPTVVSYTHPVKELTDEEIAVIGDKCFGTMSYELWVQTNEFARAILRNAQSNCNGFCGKYECRENQTECKRKASNK